MSPVVTLILLLLGIVCVIVTFLLFPGMVIADVSRREDLSRRSKGLWIGANVVLGPFAAMPYALRPGAKAVHRALAALFVVSTPLGAYGLAQMDSASRGLASDLLTVNEGIVSASAVAPHSKVEVSQAVRVLRAEINDSAWYSLERRAKATALTQILTIMTDDDVATDAEVSEWLALYRDRERTPAMTLQTEVLRRQQGL